MSAREMLEAAGRVLLLLLRTVLAGDARVLLLALPVGGVKSLNTAQMEVEINSRWTTF